MPSLAGSISAIRRARANSRASINSARSTTATVANAATSGSSTFVAERAAAAPNVPQQTLDTLNSMQPQEFLELFAANCKQKAQDQWDLGADAAAWTLQGCQEFEPYLQYDPELGGVPVRLVNAEFLLMLATFGRTLVRRQDMPEEAFVELEQLRQSKRDVRIVSVSHPWLQPDHPDPMGVNLHRLAGMLMELMRTLDGNFGKGPLAVMIDFSSMMQKGNQGEERTPAEAALFAKALPSLTLWYAHPVTFTLKITTMPTAYPRGYSFPRGISPNQASYHDRGWCFFEAMISSMVKINSKVLDLGLMPAFVPVLLYQSYPVGGSLARECMASRQPPISPADFRVALDSKAFTSKKADLAMVGDLYAKAFEERLVAAVKLPFSCMEWGDPEIKAICRLLESSELPHLTTLDLTGNLGITDVGVRALAETLCTAAAPALRAIRLSKGRQIGDSEITEDHISVDAIDALKHSRSGVEVSHEVCQDGQMDDPDGSKAREMQAMISLMQAMQMAMRNTD